MGRWYQVIAGIYQPRTAHSQLATTQKTKVSLSATPARNQSLNRLLLEIRWSDVLHSRPTPPQYWPGLTRGMSSFDSELLNLPGRDRREKDPFVNSFTFQRSQLSADGTI